MAISLVPEYTIGIYTLRSWQNSQSSTDYKLIRNIQKPVSRAEEVKVFAKKHVPFLFPFGTNTEKSLTEV